MIEWVTCEMRALFPALVGIALVLSMPVLAWPFLAKLGAMARRFQMALVFVCALAGGLMIYEARVQAYSPEIDAQCRSINETQWPCWIIILLGCACTWDDPPPPPW
jgi:hypothetical protein